MKCCAHWPTSCVGTPPTTVFVARYGGEESRCSSAVRRSGDAHARCERLRREVELMDLGAAAPGLHITLSLGVVHDARTPSASEKLPLRPTSSSMRRNSAEESRSGGWDGNRRTRAGIGSRAPVAMAPNAVCITPVRGEVSKPSWRFGCCGRAPRSSGQALRYSGRTLEKVWESG